ncbi:MAG: peptidoglycan/LPS O-acetylase OafA/YrhL [Planctomycetota bacterium]|jgi:peptidoglycan/LPS O-acetylase OafA/YrhL
MRSISPTHAFSPARPCMHTRPTHEDFRGTHTFGALDGFRSLSILAVLWHHAHGGWSSMPLSERGYLGVDMFFVISGFLIVTLLLREREGTGQISLKKFYARRTLRIFPIYYGLIAAMALLLFVVRPNSPMSESFGSELPYLLSYTSNWIHVTSILAVTWSLAAEEQFYLVWPPLEKYGKRVVVPALIVGIVISQLINYRALDPFLESNFGIVHDDFEILQATFSPILFGVVLAHFLHAPQTYARVVRTLCWRGAPIFWSVLLAVVAGSSVTDISGTPRLVIQLTMTALLASCVAAERHTLRVPLSWTPLKRIGVVSYGMYLYHMFTLHGVRAALDRMGISSPELAFVGCLAATWVVAELSFRWFETPVLRLKHRFQSAPAAAPSSTVQPSMNHSRKRVA